jgi:hypothetical protein
VRVRPLRRSASATCVYSLCIYNHMEVYMEEKHIDELIRQNASNYLYIPEVNYQDIKQVIANRNQHSQPQGGAK